MTGAGGGPPDRARAVVLDDAGVLSQTDEPIADVVPVLRSAGLGTAVLSNADGPPRPGLAGLVDVVLLSGETGVRKPDPAAFALAARRLDVAPGECVFVDDLPANVRGAAVAGLVAVVHRTRSATLAELAVLLGLPLDRLMP